MRRTLVLALRCAPILLAVTGFLTARGALALNDDFTLGDFENISYVGTDLSASTPNYNLTVPAGQINNGPTPDAVTAASDASSYPTNADYPPAGYNIPTIYPPIPGSLVGATFGNWNVIYNTGFGDWGQDHGPLAVFSNSTTAGVTKGNTAIAMNPNYFGQGSANAFGNASPNYTRHLAINLQDIGVPPGNNPTLHRDTTLADADYSNILSHKYIAVDVTFKSSDWTHGTFANTGAAGTADGPGSIGVFMYVRSSLGQTDLVSQIGLQNLGQYQQNLANPNTAVNRPADVDSRQALLGGTAGVYDAGNHSGTYTTTLYWNYSHWEANPAPPGGPPSGSFYDLRTFINNPSLVSGENGNLEFFLATAYDNGYTGGDFYFDNLRVTNQVLRLGDFNNDGQIDLNDIAVCQTALDNTPAYEANPTGLPSGDALSAQDMLSVGDINGDGIFDAADLVALDAHLGVPEPASFVLLGLATSLTAFAARKRKRHVAR